MSIRRRLSSGLALAMLVGSLLPAGSALAQEDSHTGHVVAGGLASPRGLSVGDDGNLYVAEAGSGGDQVVTIPGPDGEPTEARVGLSGQVSRITPGGQKTVVARNLPSALTGDAEAAEAAGPHGAIYANGALWVTTFGALQAPQPPPGTGALLKVNVQDGSMEEVASLQNYEKDNNPDGFLPDSNPYGLALGKDGMIYVADAGGNTLYKVNPASKELSVVSVFAGLPIPEMLRGPGPFAEGNPTRNGAFEIDPVPTGVTIGDDGTIYVGMLSGFPFLPGGTKVVSVSSDGKMADAAGGLTMVVDVEYGPDGMLYASEFGQFSLGEGGPPGFIPNSGRIMRIMPDGTSEAIAQGLSFPNGIAIMEDGTLYAAVNSLSTDDGQVMMLGNVNELTGMPVGMPTSGQGFTLDRAIYVSLLMVLGGCAILLTSRRLALRKRAL
jgi:hypothetical protein